jgi:hypothetical protein
MSREPKDAEQEVNDTTPTNSPQPTGATTELGGDPPARQVSSEGVPPQFLGAMRRVVRRTTPALERVTRAAAPIAKRAGRQGLQLSRKLIAQLRGR